MGAAVNSQAPYARQPTGYNQNYRGDQDLLNTLAGTDQRDLIQALTLNSHILARGNPTLTDRMWMEDRIKQAISSDQSAQAAPMMKAYMSSVGLDPFGQRLMTSVPSKSSGGGITKGSNLDRPAMREARGVTRAQELANQGSQRDSARNQLSIDRERMKMEQEMKMKFLNDILKKFGGSTGRDEVVTTEQLWNNAGAPMKVPVTTTKRGSGRDEILSLLGRFL